jgi:hypothetical protein
MTMEPSRKRRIARLVLFVLPMFLVVLALMVWAVSALWNWLMPAIFGVRMITYWQSLGLMALSWILFRGFRGPAMGRGPWRYEMRRRWERMTPEEREELLTGLRSRCGDSPPTR